MISCSGLGGCGRTGLTGPLLSSGSLAFAVFFRRGPPRARRLGVPLHPLPRPLPRPAFRPRLLRGLGGLLRSWACGPIPTILIRTSRKANVNSPSDRGEELLERESRGVDGEEGRRGERKIRVPVLLRTPWRREFRASPRKPPEGIFVPRNETVGRNRSSRGQRMTRASRKRPPWRGGACARRP